MRAWNIALLSVAFVSAWVVPSFGDETRARLPHRSPAWQVSRFRYTAAHTPQHEMLDVLSALTHVVIDQDAGLRGFVDGRFDMPPQRFLDWLTDHYGLAWYDDGAVLHIGARANDHPLLVRLNYGNVGDVRALLRRAGRLDARYPFSDGPIDARAVATRVIQADRMRDDRLLRITGPAAYQALVLNAARSVEQAAQLRAIDRTGAGAAMPPLAVRAITLRYRSAADRMIMVDGHRTTIDGVASQARRVLIPFDAARQGVIEFSPALPALAADPQTNTVLIRDRADKLDVDQAVVQTFDRPGGTVTIDVVSVRVADDDMVSMLHALMRSGDEKDGTSEATALAKNDGDDMAAVAHPSSALRDEAHASNDDLPHPPDAVLPGIADPAAGAQSRHWLIRADDQRRALRARIAMLVARRHASIQLDDVMIASDGVMTALDRIMPVSTSTSTSTRGNGQSLAPPIDTVSLRVVSTAPPSANASVVQPVIVRRTNDVTASAARLAIELRAGNVIHVVRCVVPEKQTLVLLDPAGEGYMRVTLLRPQRQG